MYPGGANQGGLQLHDQTAITPNTLANSSYMQGGQFPLGLINFVIGQAGEGNHNFGIFIRLAPGSHRGYLAEKIEDM